jgi:1,4-alpha-glucan branching enzyme
MSSRKGGLAIVLHAHMPYVEGYGTWPFGEEWLWEAVACVYLPLLEVLENLPVTVSLTPVLCDQLEALSGSAGERFITFLHNVRARLHADELEKRERAGETLLAQEVRRAASDYTRAEALFNAADHDVVSALAVLRGIDGPELWTSAATHAILPELATDAGLRLQVSAGVNAHKQRFGSWNGGFWLPECAYRPGLERILHDHAVRSFCVDPAALLARDPLDYLEPVATSAAPTAIPIDPEIAQLVWRSPTSYPQAHAYRDYQKATSGGLHLWRNDGEPYDHAAAMAEARIHARHFLSQVAARLDGYLAGRGRPGLVCFAIDAEVLGHWWYEGVDWLAAVAAGARAHGVELVTVPDALEWCSPVKRQLQTSSWGPPHEVSAWDAPSVARLVEEVRRTEIRTVAVAGERARSATTGFDAALARAARELLALQASDWPYLEARSLAGDYARWRIGMHSAGLETALAALECSSGPPEPQLRNLAPMVDASLLSGKGRDQ